MFLLYAKDPSRGRYHPIDWSTGAVVLNRIHATLFSAEQAARIKGDIPELEKANPGWRFQLRKTN